jgi:hypothetical protein
VDDRYHKAKTQPANSPASNPKMTSSQNLPFTHDELRGCRAPGRNFCGIPPLMLARIRLQDTFQ